MQAKLRLFLLIITDIILICLSLIGAWHTRFDSVLPVEFQSTHYLLLLCYSVVGIGCYYIFGLYKRLWQYASTGELIVIFAAVTVANALAVTTAFLLQVPLPRSILILTWMFNIMFIGGSRLAWRLCRDHWFHPVNNKQGKPALVVGAGNAGALVIRELQNLKGNGYHLIGFVDDDPYKQGQQLLGFPVLGGCADIPKLARKYQLAEIIIAIPSAPGKVIRELVQLCRETGAKLRVVPRVYDLLAGKITINKPREIRLEDLLGREPVTINLQEIAGYLHHQVVLITGAGGSIGSELCRQVAAFQPKRLILVENAENNMFDIEMELRDKYPHLRLEPEMADIRDKARINRLFEQYHPQVVFHAAAHKHVPLMERHPFEAVKNNILGTRNVAEAAARVQTAVFVFISTDKAVNPSSVMGATKRIAEMIIQSLNRISETRFCAVRFGNVLGSRGSAVPLFRQQIAKGGPVTVTHPEMKRYFMTIPEAVQLVIQAGAMATGGELFILDMGEPVKIVDLVRDLISLSGYEPEKDIEIKFTGIRPGEKLFEELLTAEEGTATTRHQRIYRARPYQGDDLALERALNELMIVGPEINAEDIFMTLEKLVPNFRSARQVAAG